MEELTDNFSQGEQYAYQFIGEFLVKFEGIVANHRRTIQIILRNQGLGEDKLSEILLARLTLEPIIAHLESMLTVVGAIGKEEKLTISKTKEVIELRNLFVHSQWSFAVATDDSKDVIMFGDKTRITKNIVGKYNLTQRIEHIQEINKWMNDLLLCSGELLRAVEEKKNLKGCMESLNGMNFSGYLKEFKNNETL